MSAYKRPARAVRRPSDRLGLELALLDGAAPLAAAPQPAREESVQQTPRRHILVVDDDPDLRHYVRQCLQEHCWITEAANGADAFAKAARIQPDLILTDAVMPLAGGAGLCRALRADPHLRNTPILAVSGEADALAGADAFLRKPFTRRQLVEAVHALLGHAL